MCSAPNAAVGPGCTLRGARGTAVLKTPLFAIFRWGVLGNTLGACKPQTDLSKLDASRVNLWSIDILFTDINLPDGPDAIDGLELARKAVALCPSLRVIYTTGHGQTDGMTALFVEDAAFLPKPYRIKQLTEAVLATAEEPAR